MSVKHHFKLFLVASSKYDFTHNHYVLTDPRRLRIRGLGHSIHSTRFFLKRHFVDPIETYDLVENCEAALRLIIHVVRTPDRGENVLIRIPTYARSVLRGPTFFSKLEKNVYEDFKKMSNIYHRAACFCHPFVFGSVIFCRKKNAFFGMLSRFA